MIIHPKNSPWLQELLYESGERKKLNIEKIHGAPYKHPVFLDSKIGYKHLYSKTLWTALLTSAVLITAFGVSTFMLGVSKHAYLEILNTLLFFPLILILSIYLTAKARTKLRAKERYQEFRWNPGTQEFKDDVLQDSFLLQDIKTISINTTDALLEIATTTRTMRFQYTPSHHKPLLDNAQRAGITISEK